MNAGKFICHLFIRYNYACASHFDICLSVNRDKGYDGIVLESWSRWAVYGVLDDPELRYMVLHLSLCSKHYSNKWFCAIISRLPDVASRELMESYHMYDFITFIIVLPFWISSLFAPIASLTKGNIWQAVVRFLNPCPTTF